MYRIKVITATGPKELEKKTNEWFAEMIQKRPNANASFVIYNMVQTQEGQNLTLTFLYDAKFE